MSVNEWLRVPVGPAGVAGRTIVTERTVLVVVHTVVTGQRLLDVVQLLEHDRRVQVVFTQGPDLLGNGVEAFLAGHGCLVMPWTQAVHTEFDLVLAASYDGVHELHGPLLVLPHGAGYGKRVPEHHGGSADTSRGVFGLDTGSLVRGGRVVPSVLVLSHVDQLVPLREQCPEAESVALVAGDPCFDRLLVSIEHRQMYRDAFGVSEGQRLVVIASTWGSRSLVARCQDALLWLTNEVRDCGDRAAMLLHPDVWYGHGIRQVRAWLSGRARDGMRLLEPDEDWRAVLAAADVVVGDHGSATGYAAAAGIPVLLAQFPEQDVAPGSVPAAVADIAPRFVAGQPLREAIAQAERAVHDGGRHVLDKLTEIPGSSASVLRSAMYELLRMAPPAALPRCEPVPVVRGRGSR